MADLYPWQNATWQRWAGLRSRLPHAILLKGPQGTGKLDFALNLAQSLLCEAPGPDGQACESCHSCRWYEQGSHPDFRLLQPEALSESEEKPTSSGKKKPSRQISVDQIRALSDFANMSAHQGGHRVVIIHPAETMNTSAANALLKTLEEPTPGMLMLLVSHKPQQLLPTILSRCLALNMPMPVIEDSLAWLEQQGVNNAEAMLAQSGFAPLLALRLAEEEGEADEYRRFMQEIRQPARLDAFALAEQMQKAEPARIIHWLQQWCHDLGTAKFAGTVRYNTEHHDVIRKLAAKIQPFELLRFQKELLTARREANHPLNAKLQFESILLSYRQMMLSGN